MIDKTLPKIGKQLYLLQRKVIVTKVYEVFGLIKIRYIDEMEEFAVDVCSLTAFPAEVKSISLKLLRRNLS